MTTYILTISCSDTTGIVAAVSGCLTRCQAFILESAQFGDTTTSRFFMRLVFTYDNDITHLQDAFSDVAQQFSMTWNLHPQTQKCKTLLLVSKHTHCLNHLLHHHDSGSLPITIAGVISNHPDAQHMVEHYGIDFYHLPITRDTKPQQEAEIYALYESLNIDLVVLARYMQILSPELTAKLSGKAINIHHSFLPGFKGANPYQQAYDRGVKLIGATAHYVTEELDEGPIIEQEVMRVDHTQSPKALQAVGQDIESLVLRRAVQYHAEHRVIPNMNKTVIFR